MLRSLLRLPFALPLLLLASCGGEPPAPLAESRARIIGGVSDTDASAHENVVFLAVNTAMGQAACTGSLIAPNVVLTARHCVSNLLVDASSCDVDGNSLNGPTVGTDLDPSAISVYTGAAPTGGPPAATATQIIHPPGDNLCNKDIALLVLDTMVTSAPPLKIRLNYGPQLGEMTTPIGYGKTTMDDFSAGQRYRRENVAVLGVGRDWNALTGENEFSMGESICQGDSGGPVLAGSSGAVIGVTSRGANCFGNNNIFSRVDVHADIIMMALAAGQAAATLEGNTPPTPPTPLDDGAGPCTDGSQCSGALCLNAGATGSSCSTVCTPGGCASAQVCLTTTVSLEGNPATLPACVPKPTAAGDCDACRFLKCKSSFEACSQDKTCSAMLLCAEPCTTKSCVDACAAANPGAASAYQAVQTCQCGAKCGTRCAVLCSDNTVGAGGAAGASSAGGNGGGGSDAAGGAGGAAAGAGGIAGASSGNGGTGTAGSGGSGASGKGGSGTSGKGGSGHAGSSLAGNGGSIGQAGSGTGQSGHSGGSSPTLPPSGTGGDPSSNPAVQPADSGSSGGCSASPASVPRPFAALAAVGALLSLGRRRAPRRAAAGKA